MARLEAAKERLAQEQKLAQRAEEEQQSGRKKPGRKPAPPEQKVNRVRKANTTDPDSRIMKTRQGHVQGYNAQAIVTTDQCIVSAEVAQEENDVHQLVPMVESMNATLDAAGIAERPRALAADAGYWHDQVDVVQVDKEGSELSISTANCWKEARALHQEGAAEGQMPLDVTPRRRMAHKVRTNEGQAVVYRLRSQTVEPVFG